MGIYTILIEYSPVPVILLIFILSPTVTFPNIPWSKEVPSTQSSRALQSTSDGSEYITFNELFSDFIFAIKLPLGSLIYNVNSTGMIWIEEEANRLIVNGLGQNERFSIYVEYQLTKSSKSNESPFFYDPVNMFFSVGIIIIIVLIFVSLKIYFDKKKEFDKKNVIAMKGLTERQKQIMELLLTSTDPLTQTTIQKKLQMPKPAVSRNIHSLERKGLIEIEKVGMSHYIHVKKP